MGGVVAYFTSPIAGVAQQAATVRRVAYISTASSTEELAGDEPINYVLRGLLKELRKLGWIEGQNLTVDRRSAEGRFERFGEILRSIVSTNADVIVTNGTDMAIEARRVTTTVPIVMNAIRDPVGDGLVSSLSRPGGNVTGISFPGAEFEGKRLEILKQALPRARRVAVLQRKAFWEGTWGRSQRQAAQALGIALVQVDTMPSDYTSALADTQRARPDAMFLGPGAEHYSPKPLEQIVAFATRERLPLFTTNRGATEAGGLLSLASNPGETSMLIARYVDRILRGAKPGDLPVEIPTRLEVIINLKTAKALGLTIPPSLLARADQVIE
jgi:putative ABC transport system substrate-binding protein